MHQICFPPGEITALPKPRNWFKVALLLRGGEGEGKKQRERGRGWNEREREGEGGMEWKGRKAETPPLSTAAYTPEYSSADAKGHKLNLQNWATKFKRIIFSPTHLLYINVT